MHTITITPKSPEQEADILAYLQNLGLRPALRKKTKTHYTLSEVINKHGDTIEEVNQAFEELISEGWDGSE